MTVPDISVVIPTRDRWALLSQRALPSALAQEGVEHEVIVVDDGSSDNTVERVRALEDDRIRLVENPHPGRVARARNAGLRAARGEWCAFLDDDDVWAPEKLCKQLDALRSDRADFAYAGVVTVDDAGYVLYETKAPAPEGLHRRLLEMSVVPAGPSNVVARTALVVELGGFDDRFANLEDWDLWIRLSDAGRAAAVHETLVAYLEHGENKSLTPSAEAFAELDDLERKHRDAYAEAGVVVDRAAYAHYVAWLQLRQQRRGRAARIYLGSAIANRQFRDVLTAGRFAVRSLLPVRRSLRRRSSAVSNAPAWFAPYQ